MPAFHPTSPTLRQLQSWLIGSISNPGAREPLGAGDLFVEPPRGSLGERLSVYSEGYPARLREALEETYPTVFHLIGHQASHSLLSRFLTANSHHSYNLGDVGRDLPVLLETDPLTSSLPFLPDLASLEWAISRAFHAFERPRLERHGLDTLTASEWLQAVLDFQPSVAVLRSQWPIRTLWMARESPIGTIDISMVGCDEIVLTRRAGLEVHCDAIESDEASVLTALLAGRPLGQLGSVLESQGSNYADVSRWFARWMSLGLLAGCRSPRRRRENRE